METSWLGRIRLPCGLIVLQAMFAGYQILSRVALNHGVSFFVFSFYRSLFALTLLIPAAQIFERKTRPPLTLKLVLKFLVLSFVGLFAAQSLFLAGAGSSSSALAAAIQNSVPVFTFIVAAAMGVEEVHIRRRDGLAKVIGTILCMSGAVTMTMYKGPHLVGHPTSGNGLNLVDYEPITETINLSANGTPLAEWVNSQAIGWSDWQVGALLCIMSSVLWATYLTLQVPIQQDHPAPLTVLALTYLFGAMQFGGAAILVERDLSLWTVQGGLPLLGVAYSGLISSGFGYTLQAWCIRMGGPLLTAACTPLQCLIALSLAVILLGDTLYLGSILGGAGIVMGLYLVTWGRNAALQIQSSTPGVKGTPQEENLTAEECPDLEKSTRLATPTEAGLTAPLLPYVST